MANKTVSMRIPSALRSKTLTLILRAQGSSSIANGSGDSVTISGSLGTATVTEAITGWFDVELLEGSTVVAEGGKLYIAADAEGTYLVDDASAVAMTVLPGRDRQVPASLRGQIAVYLGELITISRRVEDASGNGVNLSGKTLQFVIQDARGNDIAVIGSGGSGSITISGSDNSTYSFTVPTAGSAKVGNYEYSLNDVGSPNALLASGDWLVQRRAVRDT